MGKYIRCKLKTVSGKSMSLTTDPPLTILEIVINDLLPMTRRL